MKTRHVDSRLWDGRNILSALAMLALLTVSVAALSLPADEPKDAAKAPADTAKQPADTAKQPTDTAKQPMTVAAEQPTSDAPEQPKAQSPEDLLKQIEQMSRRPPTGRSRQELINSFKEMQREIIAAADKLLAHPDAAGDKGDKFSAAAIGAKISALRLLSRLGDPQAAGEAKQLLEKHAGDKRPQVSQVVNMAALVQRFTPPPNANAAALKALVADAKQHFATVKLAPEHVMIMQGLTNELQQRDATEEAVDALTAFGQLLSKSDDKRLAQVAQRFSSTARRLGLMGNAMDVYGTQLDGKQIDWKSYRGKVVLVDFWATWCGPCVTEVPNIVKNYERYHDRGFEVIGVSVDEDRKPVDKFIAQRKIPWTIAMDGEYKATGKEDSLATYYGITGIPTAILVDKEGKVVSLRARGPELGKLLEKLIGPVEGEGEKKAVEKKGEEKKEK